MFPGIHPFLFVVGFALLSLGCSPGAREVREPALPDLVVVTLDTTRADHLGSYGYFRETSPHFDAFGEQALVFERHIAPMATTLPTHTSLFTAAHPTEHGVIANVDDEGQRFARAPGLIPFAVFASELGYRTGAFVSATPLKRGSGIEEGFERFDQPRRQNRSAAATTERALSWLAEVEERAPFLLWVHYFDPHGPVDPPAPYDELFAADAALERYLRERRFADESKRPFGGRRVETRPTVNAYDGEIRFMDSEFGRLLGALRARERWAETALVVLADHGESLGQHGIPGHGGLWNEQLRAPLAMRIPGLAPGRNDALISTTDVLPTWLARLALPGIDEWLAQASGRNVLADGAERPFVVSRTSQRKAKLGKPLGFALTTERWKLVRGEDGALALYDLENDPFELAPVEAQPELRTELFEALEAAIARQTARANELGQGSAQAIPQEQLEQLEQLGYIE